MCRSTLSPGTDITLPTPPCALYALSAHPERANTAIIDTATFTTDASGRQEVGAGPAMPPDTQRLTRQLPEQIRVRPGESAEFG